MDISEILESEHSPACLLPQREAAIADDVRKIFNQSDCSSFESFKEFWRENNLSLIHHCLAPKESKIEFYQCL